VSELKQLKRIIVIGPYPPPYTGWTMRILNVQKALHERGHECLGLDIGPNRRVPREGCITAVNGLDYALKVIRYAAAGWTFHLRINGDSKKGFWLAWTATLASRVCGRGRRTVVTFQGGPHQPYFPKPSQSRFFDWMCTRILRNAAAVITDNEAVKQGVVRYGVPGERVHPISPFTRQYLDVPRAQCPEPMAKFATGKNPLLLTYAEDRQEYTLEALFEAVAALRKDFPKLGLIFTGGEPPVPAPLRDCVYLAGNVRHELFLSLLEKSTAYVRTHLQDGVCASVLEGLALGTPVVAAEDGIRPDGVVKFRGGDAADIRAKVLEGLKQPRVPRGIIPDTIQEEVDLLLRVT